MKASLAIIICFIALSWTTPSVRCQPSNDSTTDASATATTYQANNATASTDDDDGNSSRTTPAAPESSLLYRLQLNVATRSCVPFSNASTPGGVTGEAVARQLAAFCPSFAKRYLQAEGVSLFAVPGVANASGQARMAVTALFYLREFGEQLQYYSRGPVRDQLLQDLAAIQWDGSTAEDMGARVDLLTCSALYPPCERFDGDRRLLALQACDWFCEDVRQALLPLAAELAADRAALTASRYYVLLFSTSHSCIADDAVTSASPLAASTAASASPPRCQNCTKTQCGRTVVTAMHRGSPLSRSPPGRLCFNASNPQPCPAPFISTPVAAHWDAAVQDNFRAVVRVARAMLRVNESALAANGSYLPCTLDCDDSIFFTPAERQGVVVALGVICLLVFMCGIFAIGAFLLNWRRLNKYPQRIILIVNINVFISIFGIISHFFADNPDEFLCHADGSVLADVPDGSSGGSVCTLLFILAYFFSMASVAWWVCLSHAWYLTLPCIKVPDFGRSRNQRWERWYHLCTWPPVAALTVAQLAARDVGGVHFYGLCWMDNDLARFGYLVVPLCVASLFGAVFLAMGMHSFYRSRQLWRMSAVNIEDEEEDGGGGGKKRTKKRKKAKMARSSVERSMRSLLVKLWVLLVAVLLHMLVQIIVGSIRRAKWDEWTARTQQRLSCLLTTCGDGAACPPNPEVSVVLLAIPPAASGTYALSTFIWAFSADSVRLWRDFLGGLAGRARRRFAPPKSSYDMDSSHDNLETSMRTLPSAVSLDE